MPCVFPAGEVRAATGKLPENERTSAGFGSSRMQENGGNEMKDKKKEKNRSGKKMNIVLCGVCLAAAVLLVLFCVAIPMLNSASTVGNIAGVLLIILLVLCLVKIAVVAVEKYKEASK